MVRWFIVLALCLSTVVTVYATVELDLDNNQAIDISRGGTNSTTTAGAKTNIGLGNVDNTADLNKPISVLMQSALDNKQDIVNRTSHVVTELELIDANADPDTQVIVLSESIALTQNLTITKELIVVPGTTITTTGYTLTFNAPFSAGAYQVFAGTGRVKYGPATETVLPQWRGAVIDGVTDDSAAMNDTLLDVAGDGKIVRLPTGTMVMNNAFYLPSNITITGAGSGATIIKRKASSGIPMSGAIFNNVGVDMATAHLLLSGSNIVIMDMTLDCNKAQNPAAHYGIFMTGVTDVRLDRVKIIDSTYQGVRISGGKRITIRDCLFDGNGLNPIHIEDVNDFLIDNNKIYYSGDYGIEVGSGQLGILGGTSTESTGRGTVSNNYVSNCVALGIATKGTVTYPAKDTLIIGNHITNCLHGVSLNESCENIKIISNTTIANSIGIGTAVSTGASSYCEISNNIVKNNTGSGMSLASATYLTINHNIITGNGQHGITGSLGWSIISGNRIMGNATTGTNTYNGIDLNYAEYVQITGNWINNPNSNKSIAEVDGYCSHIMSMGNYVDKGHSLQNHFSFVADPFGMVDGVVKTWVIQ